MNGIEIYLYGILEVSADAVYHEIKKQYSIWRKQYGF